MRIIFDLRSTGLGNGGGSATLIKSANTLQDLNNEVFIIDDNTNRHTWNELKVPHIIVRGKNDIPTADVIIATGFHSVRHTVGADKSCGKKFHWIRGFETWQMTKDNIIKEVFNQPTCKIVNSICLQTKLKEYGIDSDICRPGHDFSDIYPIGPGVRGMKDEVWIGGLYHLKHATKRSDWIIKSVSELKEKYSNIYLMMMGADKNPEKSIIQHYIREPDIEFKNSMFNSIDLWLSPSSLEGLHIVPAEAMLTECCVIGTDSQMGGTQDYLINEKTGLVSCDDIHSFKNVIEYAINNLERTRKLGKNGRKKILDMGDRKTNMKKMMEILSSS